MTYGSEKEQVQALDHQNCNQARKRPQSSNHGQPAHDFSEVRGPWAAEDFAFSTSSGRRRGRDIDAFGQGTGIRNTYPPFLESEAAVGLPNGCAWELVESGEIGGIKHDPGISYPWVSQPKTSHINTCSNDRSLDRYVYIVNRSRTHRFILETTWSSEYLRLLPGELAIDVILPPETPSSSARLDCRCRFTNLRGLEHGRRNNQEIPDSLQLHMFP